MVFFFTLLTTSVLAGFVAAQSSTHTPGINPSSVPPADHNPWCIAQKNSCRSLCYQDVKHNYCDQTSLDYLCTCNNGTSPDLSDYTDTVPDHVCNQNLNSCIMSTNDAQAQTDCKNKFKCASVHPATITAPAAASTSTAAASSSSSSSAAATTTASAAATTSTAASAASSIGHECGVVVLAGAFLAAFGSLF